MIDRVGQLWEYRPGDTFEWRVIMVMRSDWGPDVADFVGAQIFHIALYAKELYTTNLVENLEHAKNRWEDCPYNFRRVA